MFRADLPQSIHTSERHAINRWLAWRRWGNRASQEDASHGEKERVWGEEDVVREKDKMWRETDSWGNRGSVGWGVRGLVWHTGSNLLQKSCKKS